MDNEEVLHLSNQFQYLPQLLSLNLASIGMIPRNMLLCDAILLHRNLLYLANLNDLDILNHHVSLDEIRLLKDQDKFFNIFNLVFDNL